MTAERITAIVCTVIAAAVALLLAGDHEALGLNPRAVAWLGILNGLLAIVLSLLPPIQRRSP